MSLRELLYSAYERRLSASLPLDRRPQHIGVILDGNRRWARTMGIGVSSGHRRGADKISEFLGWCDELGVEVVTLWLLSTDNLNRPKEELAPLLEIIGAAVSGLAATKRWRVNPVGALDLLPDETAQLLKSTEEDTRDLPGMTVNVAIGYGGRQEIADAVRALLQEQASHGASIEELAQVIDIEHIAAHLYTRGQPDPDLVIRTSGEQRLSGFLLWQSVHSELFFCEAYWPDFRKVDFLRAVRSFVDRDRRYGA
jgi:short-chain Z-isoprenyl diphosphate synthase